MFEAWCQRQSKLLGSELSSDDGERFFLNAMDAVEADELAEIIKTGSLQLLLERHFSAGLTEEESALNEQDISLFLHLLSEVRLGTAQCKHTEFCTDRVAGTLDACRAHTLYAFLVRLINHPDKKSPEIDMNPSEITAKPLESEVAEQVSEVIEAIQGETNAQKLRELLNASRRLREDKLTETAVLLFSADTGLHECVVSTCLAAVVRHVEDERLCLCHLWEMLFLDPNQTMREREKFDSSREQEQKNNE